MKITFKLMVSSLIALSATPCLAELHYENPRTCINRIRNFNGGSVMLTTKTGYKFDVTTSPSWKAGESKACPQEGTTDVTLWLVDDTEFENCPVAYACVPRSLARILGTTGFTREELGLEDFSNYPRP